MTAFCKNDAICPSKALNSKFSVAFSKKRVLNLGVWHYFWGIKQLCHERTRSIELSDVETYWSKDYTKKLRYKDTHSGELHYKDKHSGQPLPGWNCKKNSLTTNFRNAYMIGISNHQAVNDGKYDME